MLAELGREGRHVDFALVDAAHTREAVRGDGAALLGADACRQTVIVFHDSANAEVRAGLEDLDLPEHPKVALALLDCVPGYLVQAHDDDALVGQAFNGLALVVLDADRDPHARGPDASEFVPFPRCTRRTPRRRSRPRRARGKAAAVGSAAAVSALVGAAAGPLRAPDRPPAPLIRAAEDLS